jgi:hypothetical protein
MQNQQLLDFIKKQLQLGITKEKISSDLLANNWTKEDIEEGFNAVKIPIQSQNQPQNSIPVSSPVTFSNFNHGVAPTVEVKKSSSSKKPFILIILLFLLASGASGYYFRNELPIIRDLVKKDSNITEYTIEDEMPLKDQIEQNSETNLKENNQEQDLSAQTNATESVPPTQPKQNGVIQITAKDTVLDCGLSDTNKLNTLVYEKKDTSGTMKLKVSDFDKDKSLVCMGQALLNNCQKAIVKIQSEKGTVHTEEIVGGDTQNCSLKVTYQKVNDGDIEQKPYENSYLQCEYPKAILKDSGCFMLSNDACNYFGIKNSPAHIYSNNIGNMALVALFSPDKIKCSGNMIDNIKNSQ